MNTGAPLRTLSTNSATDFCASTAESAGMVPSSSARPPWMRRYSAARLSADRRRCRADRLHGASRLAGGCPRGRVPEFRQPQRRVVESPPLSAEVSAGVSRAPARVMPIAPLIDADADVLLRDGTTLRLRPVRDEDASAVLTLFQQLSARSLYHRFLMVPRLDLAQVRRLITVDERS